MPKPPEYTSEERLAARIIASLIYPELTHDLVTDTAQCGIYASAIDLVRDPYKEAAALSPITGRLYDSPADAATVWEGLRHMSGPATPYARIDPLVRAIGGEAAQMQQDIVKHAQATMAEGIAKNGKEPKGKPPRIQPSTDYIAAPEEQPESMLLIERLKVLGFTFRLNLCTDTIEVNGRPLDEISMAEIRVALRDIGLPKKLKAAEDAYYADAKKHSYHPVRDYLDALVWDGNDHIGQLTGHIDSSDPPIVYKSGTAMPLHHVYIYRWLIGAVAKIYTGAQNAMLVLDGPQWIGKSTLACWLCPLPGFFIEGPINVADKDTDIRLLSNWIWEVAELDATTRRADQSALKSFITRQVVTVRKSFGRNDIKKPAMASLIGTLNNTSGFLADETGSRRFMITRIDRIDLHYQDIDIAQIWAQARDLYRAGQKWQLSGEERVAQQTQNDRYEVSSILDDYVEKYFIFDPLSDQPISMADMLAELARRDIKLSGTERSQAIELARVLTRRGAKKKHTMAGNVWTGLDTRLRDDL